MKRCLILLMIFSLITGLTGCGMTQELPADPETAEDSQKIVLDYWDVRWSDSASSNYDRSLNALIREFCTQNPGIEVRVRTISQTEAYEVYLAAVSSGNEPDVCSSSMAQPMYFAAQGRALDLSPIVEQWRSEEGSVLDDMDPEYLRLYTDDGLLAGIPMGLDCRVLYYRQDYFKEAGIAKLPVTVEEFSEAFQKLKTAYPDKVPFLFSADSTASATASSLFFLSMNGAKSESEAIDTVITGRNAVSSYRALDDWIAEGYIPATVSQYSDDDVRREFLVGNACMVLGQPIASWLNETDLYGVCGVINTPAGPYAIRGYTYYSPVCYQGFSTTEYPEEARALIKWMMENNESLFTEGKCSVLPMRTSFGEKLSQQDKNIAEIYKMIDHHGRMSNYPHAVIYPFQNALSGEGILGGPLRDILGGVDVLEALSKADLEYQRILSYYGY